MKILTLLSLLMLVGCFPGQGGYVQLNEEEGATGPIDPWPQDTVAILSWFAGLEKQSPIMIPNDLNFLLARAGVSTQLINGYFLEDSFLEDGLDQTWMATNSTFGIHGKAITFAADSIVFEGFFNIDFTPIAPPETILSGTIVLVGALAEEDEVPSTRWAYTYLIKLDSGNYVWYGNQNESQAVQDAKKYGVYGYFEDFEAEGPKTNYLDMNNFYGNRFDTDQRILNQPLPQSFLENGNNQEDMYETGSNLHGVEVNFNFRSIRINGFYTHLDAPIDPPPQPENMIPGTKVRVSIDAIEDGSNSTRFSNSTLMLLDNGKYIWYGNQNP